ncbi:MAG TPA: PfkB family carbohydrate kinase, partial [Actinospica sp.]|nr:PfkB family carbohydrate kinase [Actinospica sp.]
MSESRARTARTAASAGAAGSAGQVLPGPRVLEGAGVRASGSGAEVVCIGESMAVLVPEQHGPLEDVERFHRGVGGAESNVACGFAALGVPAAWISRVGDDGFGRLLLDELAARGVDVSAVEVDQNRATGLYVKEIGGSTGSPYDLGPENSRLHYYRTGSAASELRPATLAAPAAAALLDAAGIVHVSGIT